MSLPQNDLVKAIKQLNEDANRLLLYSLYKQYADILEHLHFLNGGLPLDGYEYKADYVKRGTISWLNQVRIELKKKIDALEAN